MATFSNKKNSFAFIVIIFLLCCSGILLFCGKSSKIKFDEITWDFGKVKQGKQLVHVFKFKNDGNEPLEIKKVKTSCGCTAAVLSKKRIPPGEQGEIKVAFNTSGYAGKVQKYIFVETNESNKVKKTLVLKANIEIPPSPKISLSSYTADLGLILEKKPIEHKVTVKNEGELELEVSCSHRNASFFRGKKIIQFPLNIASGNQAEITIKIPPTKRHGIFRESVLIKSNDIKRPNMSLFLSGYVVTEKQLKELFTKHKDILK